MILDFANWYDVPILEMSLAVLMASTEPRSLLSTNDVEMLSKDVPYSSLASVPMMAWLQQSSLRRNRSVRPCLLLYLHRARTMLLMKMPVEETKRPAATPLKRVGPFEVLPLPQQTTAKTPQRLLKCCCRNS